jgi:AcrR family transcriptional regulator
MIPLSPTQKVPMEAPLQQTTRRDRTRAKNRREIAQAALAVFAEKGYDRASVQEIMDRADFAVSTFYVLFESKDDLYDKVLTDVARRCGDVFSEAMEGGRDEMDQLMKFARAKGHIYRDYPEDIRLFNKEISDQIRGTTRHGKASIPEIYDRFMLRIQELFAAGIKKKLFRHGDSAVMAASLDSMTTALLQLSIKHPDSYVYEDHIEPLLEQFFHGAVQSPKPGTHQEGR